MGSFSRLSVRRQTLGLGPSLPNRLLSIIHLKVLDSLYVPSILLTSLTGDESVSVM